MNLQRLVHAWQLSPDLHSFHPPATESDLRSVEEQIGRQLPTSFREIYLYSDGMDLLDGNLRIYPLKDADGNLGLSNASIQYRDWQYPIPDEVIIFGDNGSESRFGIWLPKVMSSVPKHPVIEFGEIFESRCMAIAGTEFLPFLTGWTAYYLMLCEGDGSALDALDVPRFLRRAASELDDDSFAEIRKWVDPELHNPYPDPYNGGYDLEGIRRVF